MLGRGEGGEEGEGRVRERREWRGEEGEVEREGRNGC